MKTNKHQTLLLTKQHDRVNARDVVHRFGYSAGTARSYLSHLARQDLLQKSGPGYVLTEKGEERLTYFQVRGCERPDCPLCLDKAGFFSCSRCGTRFPQTEARIRPARDFFLVRRPAGVHCPICLSQILTETQARLMGVKESR